MEWGGRITVSNPHERPGVLDGRPVTMPQWRSSTGTRLVSVVFRLNGHVYEVLGIDESLAVAERVARGLMP